MDSQPSPNRRPSGPRGRVRVVKVAGVLADATIWIRRIVLFLGVFLALAGMAKLAYGPVKVV